MAWTTPKTWSSEPLTSIDLNTYVRDNQNFLKDRVDGSAAKQGTASTGNSTTSITFVDVDAVNLSVTLTTTGGDVAFSMVANGYNDGSSRYVMTQIDVDSGAAIYEGSQSDDGAIDPGDNMSFVRIIGGLSAGSHTFKLQYKANVTGTAYLDVYAMDVREVAQVAT